MELSVGKWTVTSAMRRNGKDMRRRLGKMLSICNWWGMRCGSGWRLVRRKWREQRSIKYFHVVEYRRVGYFNNHIFSEGHNDAIINSNVGVHGILTKYQCSRVGEDAPGQDDSVMRAESGKKLRKLKRRCCLG